MLGAPAGYSAQPLGSPGSYPEPPPSESGTRSLELKAPFISGGRSASQHHAPPRFPVTREFQDGGWAALLAAHVLFGLLLTGVYTRFCGLGGECPIATDAQYVEYSHGLLHNVLAAGAAGASCGLAAAFSLMVLVHKQASRSARTVLFATFPATTLFGMCLIFLGTWGIVSDRDALKGGALMVALGMATVPIASCATAWAFMTFEDRVDPTIVMLETVAEIAEDHRCMIVVSLFGAIGSVLWILLFSAAIGELVGRWQANIEGLDGDLSVLILIANLLVAIWGARTISGICHCTYCGIFGRWYFEEEHHSRKSKSPIWPSLAIALGSSFGSVCFAALPASALHEVGVLLRIGHRCARAARCNAVSCILWCSAACLLSCIRDTVDYFNDWAQVQCALRGTPFCQSVRIIHGVCSRADIRHIAGGLLVNHLVLLVSLVCGLVGAIASMTAGVLTSGPGEAALLAEYAGLIGCGGGLAAGLGSMSIFSAGSQTILAAWAEDPRLKVEHYMREVQRLLADVHVNDDDEATAAEEEEEEEEQEDPTLLFG